MKNKKKIRLLSLILSAVLASMTLASCTPASAEGGTEPKSTAKQTTEKPTTEAATTEAVTTEAVTTEAVTTETVTTDTVTEQAVTTEPTTEPNTTLPSVSEEVTTMPDWWVEAQEKSKIEAEGVSISEEFHREVQHAIIDALGLDKNAIPTLRYVFFEDDLLLAYLCEYDGNHQWMWLQPNRIAIEGYTFVLEQDWFPWVYKDGTAMRLETAYSEGLIDAQELKELYLAYEKDKNTTATE